MPTNKGYGRMDFVMKAVELISEDENGATFSFALEPNPERYVYIKEKDKEGYYDKFEKVFIPIEVYKKAASSLHGKPIYYTPCDIDRIENYIRERIPEIESYLDKREPLYDFEDKSEEFLVGLSKDEMRFVILSIDLVGSTKLSQSIKSEEFSKIVSLFTREMALIVGKFSGYVLKFTGDGIIAYFPEPNFIGMHDNAVDCAMGMKLTILHGINKVLRDRNLPELAFRIGLDSGEATVITAGTEKVKMQKDLLGETINLACKIQSIAPPNEIYVGESIWRLVHVNWKKRMEKRKLPKDWEYTYGKGKSLYPVYALVR